MTNLSWKAAGIIHDLGFYGETALAFMSRYSVDSTARPSATTAFL